MHVMCMAISTHRNMAFRSIVPCMHMHHMIRDPAFHPALSCQVRELCHTPHMSPHGPLIHHMSNLQTIREYLYISTHNYACEAQQSFAGLSVCDWSRVNIMKCYSTALTHVFRIKRFP